MEISEGNIVLLKGQFVKMTVVTKLSSCQVRCGWYNHNNDYREEIFNIDVLDKE